MNEIESSFREESSRLTAALVRRLGPRHLDLIEDVVQETFLRAMQQWSMKGPPPNPAAWLRTTARNLAIDRLRREKLYAEPEHLVRIEAPESSGMVDDEFAMLFMCATPELPPESRIPLMLKTLGGLSVAEIASAMLAQESAIAQRLVRAKTFLRDGNIAFEMPENPEVRLPAVLKTLYLMFNEGYSPTSGDDAIKPELCYEAIILTERLAKTVSDEKVHALLALMCFHASRLPARETSCSLGDQDRSLWDRQLIGKGLRHLEASQRDLLTSYHSEAAISSLHCCASSYEDTNWNAILEQYELLLTIDPTPITRLNRAIALSMSGKVDEALRETEELTVPLAKYPLYHATKGGLLREVGDKRAAAEAYETAIRLSKNESERRHFQKQLSAVSSA